MNETRFANIIIDISHESVDRTFQYRVPERLFGQLSVGQQVAIPFGAGDKLRKGYIVELTNRAEFDESRMKEIADVVTGSVPAQAQLIALAWWMKERYGSTMNQALKTVLPVKERIKEVQKRQIRLLLSKEELSEAIAVAKKRHYTARLRLLEELEKEPILSWEAVSAKHRLTLSAVRPMEEAGMVAIETITRYRNPLEEMARLAEGAQNFKNTPVILNSDQQVAVDAIGSDLSSKQPGTWLIHGVTGSGKTEVYMELIEQVLLRGRQAILLIPEISLTWQTVMRFYRRFGSRVSVINSRLSAGERYDQYERARTGDIDILIGPRSALFAPFSRLGLIIIDEEHENAYKSELSPRYHAREVAAWRARENGAPLVLGSATPSLESYTKALAGEYTLVTLKHRASANSRMASVEVVDLRAELAAGNKSIFSRRLAQLLNERLERGEQAMLFINRRGYANFVSCRSCGEAMRCPHCDVTLTLHRDGRLMCHYCGYTVPLPQKCPTCGSPYIAPFGTGTQKIEEMTRKMFPKARVLRMDLDTTSKKGGHQEILSAFARREADILIGTQMIVKGHDFPGVTLVGALAADLSLYAPDYRCGEQTFDLLTQAAGRAGRAGSSGVMVIQTYQPQHYAITTAAAQDYPSFYRQEMNFRRVLGYPPAVGMLIVQLSGADESALERGANDLAEFLKTQLPERALAGPVNASVYKINDIYRKIFYIKQGNYDILIRIRKNSEEYIRTQECFAGLAVQYDLT